MNLKYSILESRATKPHGAKKRSGFLSIFSVLGYIAGLGAALLFVQCGEAPQDSSSLHLSGGAEFSMDQAERYPGFYVRLVIKAGSNEQATRCTGTHLGQGVILTAAHCLVHTDNSDRSKRMIIKRVDYITKKSDGSKEIASLSESQILGIKVHPKYEQIVFGTMLFDDIALMFTRPPADKPFADHAKLPRSEYLHYSQITGDVMMYGDGIPRDKLDQNPQPRFFGGAVLDSDPYSGVHPDALASLRQVKDLDDLAGTIRAKLNEYLGSNYSTSSRFSIRRKDHDKRQAAGLPHTKLSLNAEGYKEREGYVRGTCKGDSGGSAIRQMAGENIVVGVTSATLMHEDCYDWVETDCCSKAEFANVYAYLDWIGSEFQARELTWPPFGTLTDEERKSDDQGSTEAEEQQGSDTIFGCSTDAFSF